MVTVRISLQLKRHIWHIEAYEIDSTQEEQPVILLEYLRRKFISPEAAMSYTKRIVLGRLRLQRPDATDADVVCEVTVRSQE